MIATGLSILEEAVARNSGAVLSLPSAGMLRHHKSRFLGDTPEGLWVESPASDATLVDALIEHARPVGISFKSGQNKAIFSSKLLRRDPSYRINDQVTVEAVLVSHPSDIKVVQRRATYRARVPDDYDMSVRIWRIGRYADLHDTPLSSTEVNARLVNFSIGGIGIIVYGKNGQPPTITPEDRLRVELTIHNEQVLVEGRICYQSAPLPGDGCRAGVQFQALQDDIEGRRITNLLTRVLGELQRLELRRHRMAML